MIETMFASEALNSPTAFLCALILGVAFGWCLEQAGLGNSRRVAGVFYFQDMLVLKVMLSAAITSVIGLGLLFTFGILRPESVFIQPTILGAQIAGGLIFGIGLVMSGWCPATATVGAASGRLDAVVFILGVIVGSYIFNLSFDYIEFWYAWGNIGESLAFKVLGLRYHDFILLFTVVAVVLFWLSELIEEKFSFAAVAARSSGLWVYSVVALLGASMVVAAGMPGRSTLPVTGNFDSSALLAALNSGSDLISPQDLARAMIAGQKKIALVDLRHAEEFDIWKIRGSVNSSIDSLNHMLERYRKHDLVILCSNDGISAGQAWVLARAAGYENVVILDGGVRSFAEQVLKPVSLRDEHVDDSLKLEINQWRQMFTGAGITAGAAAPVGNIPHGNSPH